MSVDQSVTNPPKKSSHTLLTATVIVLAMVIIGTWAAYTFGEGHIQIDGRTVSELQPWEVVGAVLLAIVGVVIGLIGGLIGIIIGLAAAALSLILGAAGVAVGLFITLGVLLGPALLLVAIILLFRRSKAKSQAAATDDAV